MNGKCDDYDVLVLHADDDPAPDDKTPGEPGG